MFENLSAILSPDEILKPLSDGFGCECRCIGKLGAHFCAKFCSFK